MKETLTKKISSLIQRIKSMVNYCISGVWSDPHRNTKVRLIRTLNLSVSSFLNRGLQLKSMALTYSTILALVPAIALLVAIGRGFGLQDTLMNELYNFFPSQHRAISAALTFVDAYLNEATQGVFVGVGILFLLWTVISLLSYITDAFNSIWGIKQDRSFFQKITDYISICLIIPILMICSSGVSIFMSTAVQDNLYFPFLSPMVHLFLDIAPFILTFLAFTLCYQLIPNTKVNIKYSAISGLLAAIAFQVLQLLFVNGQIYVSKYNAIYGSFAFLPLLLIWLQLSWMILLAGCVLTYSLQNVFTFNFNMNSDKLSLSGWRNIAMIVMGVICKLYIKHQKPLTQIRIAVEYNLPIRVVNRLVEKFHEANLTYSVKLEEGVFGEVPAMELQNFTLADFLKTFDHKGESDIMPEIHQLYSELYTMLAPMKLKSYDAFSSVLMRDLPIPTPEQIHQSILSMDEDLPPN